MTCTKKDISSAIENRVRQKLPTLRKSGFRKGKIPFDHALEMMKNDLYLPVIEGLCEELYEDIFKKKTIQDPVFAPAYQLKTPYETLLHTGGPCEVTMTVHTLPSFSLETLTSITIEKPMTELTDATVEEGLRELGQRYPHLSSVERKCRRDDVVQLSYMQLSSFDSQTISSTFSESVRIPVGSDSLHIPPLHRELGKHLVNLSTGEEKNVTITLPFSPSGEKKNLSFRVRIEKIFVADPPSIDEALAQRLGVKTLKELTQKLKEQMLEADLQRQSSYMKHSLLEQLQQHYRFDIPPLLIKKILDQQEQEHIAKEKKHPLPQREQRENMLIKNIRLSAVLRRFAEEENIALDEKELKEALFSTLRQTPQKDHQKIQESCLQDPSFLKKMCQPFLEDKILTTMLKKISFLPKMMSRLEFYAPTAGSNHP